MRISNETKVGALTVIAVTLIILGFNFLRGKTIFKTGNFIYAKYKETKGLIISNPVYINGFQVGTVFDIENTTKDLSEIVVTIKLNELYTIPDNSVAAIQENPLGTNSISVVLGDSKKYLQKEDTITTARAASLLGDIMNTLSPLGEQTKNTISSIQVVLNNINKVLNDQNKENFKTILDNLTKTTASLNNSMSSVEGMLQKQNGSIAQSFDNVNKFTKNLNDNNQKINNLLGNLDSTSKQLKEANIGAAITSLHDGIDALTKTLQKVNNGNGTASKLLNDASLYKELQNTVNSLNTLLDDVRIHPKRYIHVSVFGKKDKSAPLTKPIADSISND